jgi:hypothetical protein
MIVGIIGSKTFHRPTLVKELLYSIKTSFGPLATIVTGGQLDGIETDVKKYCLEFEINYKEFNPSFTGWNKYSFMGEKYFGKNFHPSHFDDRYKQLIYKADALFLGIDGEKDEKYFKKFVNLAVKKGIKSVLL